MPASASFRVAFYDNAFDAVPKSETLTWEALVQRLSTHRVSPRELCAFDPCTGRDAKGKPCAGKNGAAWSPVEIEGSRSNDNVSAVTVGVFDVDHPPDDSWFERVRVSGFEFVVHSTHQYPHDERFRLVLPLSRSVAPEEWHAVHAAIVARLGLPADPLRDLSRIYFLPNGVSGAETLFHHEPGQPVDIDEIVRQRASAAATATVVIQSEPDPIDVNELAAEIRRHASGPNRALVAQTLRGESLGPQGSANPYGGQDRALQALMSTAAFCAPDEAPWEAVEHLFRPAFAATNWNEGTEHLIGQARDKFDRARERKKARDAQRAAENDAIRAGLGLARASNTAAPAPLDEGATEDPDRWVSKLIADDKGKLKNCEANISLVLRNAPEWRGLRFNAVTKQLEVKNPPMQVSSPDALDVHIAIWFQQSDWGKLGLTPKPKTIVDVLRSLPELISYDPLREYLEGLRWDGTPRIGTFFEHYFGAVSGPDGDPVEYLRAVSRRWLISLVTRGLRPGEKVDTVLCLEGAQGLGKSTALKLLASPWFCDSKIDVGSKDSWALAAQFWLLELAETEGMTRATADALKGFFSKSDDTYRPPYGRTNTTTLRRAIFATTTNAQRYLRFDPTGYRRYWPVACSKVDLAAIRADREQLFAEAVAAFNAGELWYFMPGTPEADLAEAAARRREDVLNEAAQEMIVEWFTTTPKEKRPPNVKVSELLTHPNVFGLQRHQITAAREKEVVDALRALGFERYSSSRGKAWRTPAELLTAAQVTQMRPVQSTARTTEGETVQNTELTRTSTS